MTKQQELAAAAEGRGCLGRSQDDEPVFILCARDRVASQTVRDWAGRFAAAAGGLSHLSETQRAKHDEAMQAAYVMDVWRDAHGGGKVPD